MILGRSTAIEREALDMVRTRRVSGARVASRRHVLRGPGYFKRLGPGIVTGAADDDPSGRREGLGRRVRQARAFYAVMAALSVLAVLR